MSLVPFTNLAHSSEPLYPLVVCFGRRCIAQGVRWSVHFFPIFPLVVSPEVDVFLGVGWGGYLAQDMEDDRKG